MNDLSTCIEPARKRGHNVERRGHFNVAKRPRACLAVELCAIALSSLLLGCSSSGHQPDSAAPPDSGPTDVPADLAQADLAPADLALPDLSPDQRRPDLKSWPDFGPTRPYQNIEHLTEGALKTALYNLVKSHSALSYEKAREAIFTIAGGGVDVVGGLIEGIYTGVTAAPDGTTAPGTFNTEHSWPKSEGASKAPAVSDLNHLFACDSSANSYRGNLPYGNTQCVSAGGCSWSVGGSAIGPVAGGAGKVIMVRPGRRGDIARAHFYFSVRYQLPIPLAEEKWLREWNLTDAPDQREITRAKAIEGIQKKRNPFVERPDFVQQISDF